MNLERISTAAIAGVIAVALATTVLARSNTARVIDSGGSAFARVISAALGQGVNLR